MARLSPFGRLGVAVRPASVKLAGATAMIGGVLLTLVGNRLVALISGRGPA